MRGGLRGGRALQIKNRSGVSAGRPRDAGAPGVVRWQSTTDPTELRSSKELCTAEGKQGGQMETLHVHVHVGLWGIGI